MTELELADQWEDREIRIYQLWRGWAQEQALAETERRLRREAVRKVGGHSPSRFAAVRRGFWAAGLGAVLAIALTLAIVQQSH